MASVVINRTTPLFPSAVFVQWVIFPDEAGAHLVDVYRSGSPMGPWQPIAQSLLNTYQYLDDRFNVPPPPQPATDEQEAFNLLSLSREVYYLVTVTPPSGLANAFSSAATPIEPYLDTRTRLFKRKILHDEATAFRSLNGVPLAVLKRLRWGTRCRECWDPITREATHEHCPHCFGTGFEGGYWAPVQIRGRKSAAPVQTQITAQGNNDLKLVSFTVLDYPHLEYQDVLVDLRRNERYLIQTVTPTTLKGVIVHQVATASEIARNAVEYRVPVDPTASPPLY